MNLFQEVVAIFLVCVKICIEHKESVNLES